MSIMEPLLVLMKKDYDLYVSDINGNNLFRTAHPEMEILKPDSFKIWYQRKVEEAKELFEDDSIPVDTQFFKNDEEKIEFIKQSNEIPIEFNIIGDKQPNMGGEDG